MRMILIQLFGCALRQSAKVKCKSEGALRLSAKVKCKSDVSAARRDICPLLCEV